MSVSRKVRSIIAKECGVTRKSVANNTQFMANQTLSYFGCVGALYTLQHKFNVYLPESSYEKYETVDNLIKDIKRQLKHRSR